MIQKELEVQQCLLYIHCNIHACEHRILKSVIVSVVLWYWFHSLVLFQVSVTARDDVPFFGPSLPNPAIFRKVCFIVRWQGKILHTLLFAVVFTVVLSVWLDGFGGLKSSKVELLSPDVSIAVFISRRVFILFCRVQSFVNSFWSSSSMLNTAAIELKNLLN